MIKWNKVCCKADQLHRLLTGQRKELFVIRKLIKSGANPDVKCGSVSPIDAYRNNTDDISSSHITYLADSAANDYILYLLTNHSRDIPTPELFLTKLWRHDVYNECNNLARYTEVLLELNTDFDVATVPGESIIYLDVGMLRVLLQHEARKCKWEAMSSHVNTLMDALIRIVTVTESGNEITKCQQRKLCSYVIEELCNGYLREEDAALEITQNVGVLTDGELKWVKNYHLS